MSNASLLDTAKKAVDLALQKGAKEAGAGAYRVREIGVTWRDGKLEKITEATTRGVSLALYVDERYSSVSTSDLRPEALERFVVSSIALTRTLAKDPFRSLPDPALYKGQAEIDLEIEDASVTALEAAERRRLAQELEAAARSAQGSDKIISVTTDVGDVKSESVRVHSNGFSGTRQDTRFWCGADVSVKDPDGRKPEEYWGATVRRRADLPKAADVGRTATERALARIGAKKTDSKLMPMVIENRSGGRLFSFLMDPLSARALQQKRSFLDGKVGSAVGSKLLDVADDPHVTRGLGSRLFDNEGLAAKRFPIFEGGALKTYYVDDYYGKKLKMKPTTARSSNLVWKPGDKGRDALIAAIQDGVFVTGFLGGNSNATTGDFSLGVQGFRIRGGKLAEPLTEMNIAGNHLELWNHLVAVGDDPWLYSSSRSPTLVFDAVQFAGA